jgi:hypothetical protein
MKSKWVQPVISYEYRSRYGQPAKWMYCLRYFPGGAVFNGYDTKEDAERYIHDCDITGRWIYYGREDVMRRIVNKW